MSDRDDTHDARYAGVLSRMLAERLVARNKRADTKEITTPSCTGTYECGQDEEIAALDWAVSQLSPLSHEDGRGQRCICRQLEYAVAWEQEKSEVPVFTFDGQIDYGTVLKHDLRCPARPLTEPVTDAESAKYAHKWVQDFIISVVRPFEERATATERERIRLDMLADAAKLEIDDTTEYGVWGDALTLQTYARKLEPLGPSMDSEHLAAVELGTPADRGNSASDTHERTTRHDDRGKIQGVDR